MATMSTRTLAGIEKLGQERQETLAELERLRVDLRNLAEPGADEADYDAFEREKTWALIQTVERKLASIEHAMELARAGSYGVCQSCNVRIDPARLEILPAACLCLTCQRDYERRHRRR